MNLVWIALFGSLGAVSRYGVGMLSVRLLGTHFIYGTLAVNVLGCFLLGVLLPSGPESSLVHPTVRLAISVGFLGGFTTFSTFGYETVRCLQSGDWFAAGANVTANLVLGLAAVVAGFWLSRALWAGV